MTEMRDIRKETKLNVVKASSKLFVLYKMYVCEAPTALLAHKLMVTDDTTNYQIMLF